MTRAILATVFFCFLASHADAHVRHHYYRHLHYAKAVKTQDQVPQWNWFGFQSPQQTEAGQHTTYAAKTYSSGGITHARLADGQVIAVASNYADRFVGFFNALYRREGHLAHITCLASGHMAHSLHHWGGACDVGQRARNVAWRAMYHVGGLAQEFGLTDGCIWNHPDCGHVDVSGVGGGRHYARRTRYAHHSHHHYAGA